MTTTTKRADELVDLLCKALYGRPGQGPDWLGGSEARMLYDAVEEIARLRDEVARLKQQ